MGQDELQRKEVIPNTEDKKVDKPLRTTAKDGKIVKMKKKDKLKMKKQLLHEKLAAIEFVKKEAKNKKKREETVIVGDLKPLTDHINIIDEIIKSGEEKRSKRSSH